MPDDILSSESPVTLLGGGECSRATLNECLRRAPVLMATDGAAGVALRHGHEPKAVIGDMDSLAPDDAARLPAGALIEVGEQETTDFDKALRMIEAPLVLGAGFMGARLDHELACLASLARHDRPGRRAILVGEHDLVFHAPPELELALAPGTRLSLFPLAPVRVTGAGLVWPLEGLELSPLGRLGTSNEVGPGGAVSLAVEGRGLMVIAPVATLDAAIAALTG